MIGAELVHLLLERRVIGEHKYSQPEALRKLCHSFCHTAAMQVYGCQTNLRLPILPPEENTITVVLHSTTSTFIPIAYSLLNNCPERPIAYTLYKPPTHCFYPPAFPHIAYNASYSPQNALYWLFVFSWYNFPSVCKNRLQLNSAVRTEMALQRQLHLPRLFLLRLRIHSLKNSRPKFNGRLYLFLYY